VHHFTNVELILLLLVVTTLLAVLAQRLKVAYPIVLVLGGLVLGLVPGLPRVELDPDLVFKLFLPPLLFSAAFFMPWPEFKASLRPILLLAVGLVGATAAAVAYVASAIFGLPLAVGFALGAIVSPPDAIAATAIAQRLRLPHRMIVILEGESLINDAAGLVLFRFAVAAVVTGTFSLPLALLEFAELAIGGIAFGLGFAWVSVRVFRRMSDPAIVTVLTLLAPFAAYLPAEIMGFSGVLSAVTAGIYVGWHAPTTFTPPTRVRATFVWNTFNFLLNGLVFILIGLQLPFILEEIADESPLRLAFAAVAVSAVVIAVRAVYIFGTYWLSDLISPPHERSPSWRNLAVLSWAGMRGIVSLAAALALPELIASGEPFPYRGLVLFLAFAVILVTLVMQGLTLPPLLRGLGVCEAGNEDERIEARRFALEAALMKLDELEGREDLPAEGLAHLRERYRHSLRVLDERDVDVGDLETHRQIQLELIEAERKVLLEMRQHGAISDAIFHELERALDMRVTWLG
jgi:CPA1 family monovalent cation:H+ antiporter